tara:strand:- start:492 stop:650 length:159 start_codon:yes stop_codon:yes gene_type:complete
MEKSKPVERLHPHTEAANGSNNSQFFSSQDLELEQEPGTETYDYSHVDSVTD